MVEECGDFGLFCEYCYFDCVFFFVVVDVWVCVFC